MLQRKFFNIIVLTALALIINTARAQYSITMEDTDVPKNLAEQVANSQDAATIAALTPGDLIQAITKSGQKPDKNITKIYVAENGHYAVESSAMKEKTTIVYNGKFNMIMWNQKKVIQMTPEQIKEMANTAQNMMNQMQQNMPDMSKMLENANLTPEQKEAAKKAMAGMNTGNQAPQSEPTVKATNKSATIVGQPTKLHIITDGNKTKGVWVSGADKALAKKFREMGENMEAFSAMAKNKGIQEWKLLPGMYMLASVEVSKSVYGANNVKVTQTVELVNSITNKSAFNVPGQAEGFIVGGPELMMSGPGGKRK